MRRVFLLLVTLLMISVIASKAQHQVPNRNEAGVPRNFVVIEIGTGTWCGNCPGASMGAHDLMEGGYDVAVIKYHNGDPFANNHSNSRNGYYGVTGYPTTFIDGRDKIIGGYPATSMFSHYLPIYNSRIATPSFFTLNASVFNTSENNWKLTMNTERIVETENKTYKLHAVITESHIEYNWFNQTEVNNAVRLMLPNSSGTTLSFADVDNHQVVLEFDVSDEYVLENLELIVFLQDYATKEIVQAQKMILDPDAEEEEDDDEDETGVGTHDQMITNIYPNPASGYVSVVTTKPNAVLKVVGMQGQVILTQQINSNNQEIDISRFNSGLYLFMVTTELSTYTQKVIVK